MSVSIHVTDGVYGRPADGLSINFSRELDGAVVERWRDQTGEDGRISGLVTSSQSGGSYVLEIDFDGYFPALGYASIISVVSARFRVANDTINHELSIFITPASCFILRAD